MMKAKTLKIVALVLALVFAVTVVGCGAKKETSDKGGTSTKPVTVRVAYTVSPEHSYGVAARQFKKEVEEKSNGSIKVELLEGGVFGGDRDATQAVARGDLEMTWTSDIGLAAVWPELGFVNLPYLFKDYNDVDARYRNGWIGEYLTKFLKDKGVVVLGIGENDFRGFTNSKRPITKGSDLKGLKMRVPETPMYVDFYKSLGVLPTPMAITEVATALQQKTVDGQDNGAIITYDMGFYQFQKYAVRANQMYSAMVMCMSQKVWDKLTPDQQKILADASKSAADLQVKLNRENVAKDWKAMEDKGMQVIEPTPELQKDFQAVADRMYKDPQYEKAYGKEVMDRINQERGQ